MPRKKKILLSGATGFLGKALRTLSQFEVETAGRHPDDQVRTDLKEIETIPSGYDALLHFASAISVRTPPDSGKFVHDRLAESFSFMRAFARANPKAHIIYPSSGGTIYGDSKNQKPFVEEDPLLGTTPYALSKVSHETFLFNLVSETKVNCTILRIANPFGHIRSTEKKQGLLGVAINCLQEGKSLDLLDPIFVVRDFLYIKDFRDAVELVISKEPTSNFRIYNLGSGVGTDIGAALQTLQGVYEKRLELIVKPNPSPGLSWNVLNIDKFKNEFGWAPKFTLRQGLEDLRRASDA